MNWYQYLSVALAIAHVVVHQKEKMDLLLRKNDRQIIVISDWLKLTSNLIG